MATSFGDRRQIGWRSRQACRPLGLALTIALDIQLLLGVRFVVSPTMTEIRANVSAAMWDPVARFWAVEHVTIMLGAAILARVGRVPARKAGGASATRPRATVAQAGCSEVTAEVRTRP